MFCWDTLGSHIATWPIETLDILLGVCCLSPIHEGRTFQHTGQPRSCSMHLQIKAVLSHKRNLHHIKQVGFNAAYDYSIFYLANIA